MISDRTGVETRQSADLVVLNGKVLTVDAEFRIAHAVAIRDGIFVCVGTNEAARALVGRTTRVIDVQGKTIVPGLIDTHVHALGVAASEARESFRAFQSVAEVQEWIREKVESLPPGRWLWSPRIFPTRLRERRFPTRVELDAPANGHAVAIDGAYAFMLNTAALQAAAITGRTPSPPGGAIVTDASGEPTGLLRNVGGYLDRYRGDERQETPLDALEQVHRRYNHVGITSVCERGADIAGYRRYEALNAEGRLSVRANVTLRITSDGTVEGTESILRDLPLRFGDGDDHVRVGPLKIIVDGGILAGTSSMREPYDLGAAALYGVEDPAYRGLLSLEPKKIKAIIRTGHRLGWPMCAHVTGDAGVDAVLDAVEAANADSPIRDRRFTLIHAYFPNTESARRAAELGVCVDTQPAWYYKDADALMGALGEKRLRLFIGLAEWRRAGVTTALSTDHMFGLDADTAINPFNPFLTLYVAVTRKTESGQVMGPEQAVSREEALRMITIEAACLTFDEKRKGSIEVGKLGDLAVLSDDFMSCPPGRIKHIRVVATVLGGHLVHELRGSFRSK